MDMDERCRDKCPVTSIYSSIRVSNPSSLSIICDKPHYNYTCTSSVVTPLFGVALSPQSILKTMTAAATKERARNMATCVAI